MEEKRKKYTRRQQQVRRQLLILGTILVLVVIAMISIGSRFAGKKEVQATAKKEQTEKKETTTKETEEQRLARVKKEAKAAGYPEGVTALLDKNPETIDFVEHYGELSGALSEESIPEDFMKEKIPQLLQWDERWGYAPYGTSIVAVSGCGPTCMSMVVAGLTGDASVTPAVVARYGTENHYLDEDNNTYWEFMRQAGKNWNVTCYEGMLTEEQTAAELAAGHPIICSVGPGDFTKSGHFIVLTAYENGQVKVNDPFSQSNSEKLWTFSAIQSQFKSMWVYSL